MSKILVVVDMQNDFITGSLGTKEAQGIVDRVAQKIQERRADGWQVCITKDTHETSYLQTQEGKNLPVAHCIRDTWGWELADEIIAVLDGTEKVFEKPSFGSVKLMQYLTEMAPASIEFVGLCTDICVVSNALGVKAWLPETPILVDRSCCAGVTPEAHEAALRTMQSCQIQIEDI